MRTFLIIWLNHYTFAGAICIDELFECINTEVVIHTVLNQLGDFAILNVIQTHEHVQLLNLMDIPMHYSSDS